MVQDVFNVLCISALKLISLFDAPPAYKAGFALNYLVAFD